MNIKLNQDKIKVIGINEDAYPEKLRNIYAPPQRLYAVGNLEALKDKSIAIVGCRECSKYGMDNAMKFGYELAKKGVCIISGLARGIDTYAHWGAIKAYGKTIAVLGCGLDVIYPKENLVLYKEILRTGGLIISEYPLGTKPERHHFPARNRIISGLSNGVLVIEAKKRSGTLITVNHALEQGKDVYALPGNISSSNSYGTNELIKEGAIPVTHVKDIFI